MIIDSNAKVLVGEEMPTRTSREVKSEAMLFNCDRDHAYSQGGNLTKDFLQRLPRDWQDVDIVVDSRVHMLMAGWYPCIPGWHHDDVPRTRSDGQPNYLPGQCRSEHILALVGGEICPTEFAVGAATFEMPPLGATVYEQWDKDVELLCQNGVLNKMKVPSNKLIQFDDRAWHRGTAAIDNGWRFFIRASRYFSPEGQPIARGNPRTNEIRRQVQVYMPTINQGW